MKKKQNVLVVDDSVLILLGLKKTLLDNDIRAYLAHDGKKAIEILMTEKIDLVLLDLMMPVTSGVEVVEFMKNNSDLSKIPIVVISGASDTALLEQVKQKGVYDILQKPVMPKTLIRVINKALDKPAK